MVDALGRDAPGELGKRENGDASSSSDQQPESATALPAPSKPTTHYEFVILPIPHRLRYNPSQPPRLSLGLNVLFGICATVTVANLYWCQPLLIDMASSFGTTYEEISKVPTLAQSGYATGLLLIAPLGDLLKRRQLILLLVTVSTLLTVGLATTHNATAFMALTFLTATVSVTSQVALPLVADLAPDHRRATAMSIVLSGVLLGILVARVIGGSLAQYKPWRNVYDMSIALQGAVLVLLYFFLPDYPRKNDHLKYFGILKSMAKFAVTEPVLIHSCLMGFCAGAYFAGFWVTLTFLLGGDPYNLSTLVIGLFGLIGMAGVLSAPLGGRIIDRYKPWLGVLIGHLCLIVTAAIYTGGAGVSLAVPIIVALIMDFGQQMQMTSNVARIVVVNPSARARFNAVYVIVLFLGQVTGTQASSTIFLRYGWRASGAFWLGLEGFAILLHLCRGPNAGPRTAFGYEGGWNPLKPKQPASVEDLEDGQPPKTDVELK